MLTSANTQKKKKILIKFCYYLSLIHSFPLQATQTPSKSLNKGKEKKNHHTETTQYIDVLFLQFASAIAASAHFTPHIDPPAHTSISCAAPHPYNLKTFLFTPISPLSAPLPPPSSMETNKQQKKKKWFLPLVFSLLVTTILILLSIFVSSDSNSLLYLYRSRLRTHEVPHFVESKLSLSSTSTPNTVPRIAYLISGSMGDGESLKRTLKALYHPRNQYAVHLDLEAPAHERLDLANFVRNEPLFTELGNVRMVVKANLVTYRGPTMVTNTLHAAAILLKDGGDWDWFINLSASDYPLVTQDGKEFVNFQSFVDAPLDRLLVFSCQVCVLMSKTMLRFCWLMCALFAGADLFSLAVCEFGVDDLNAVFVLE